MQFLKLMEMFYKGYIYTKHQQMSLYLSDSHINLHSEKFWIFAIWPIFAYRYSFSFVFSYCEMLHYQVLLSA